MASYISTIFILIFLFPSVCFSSGSVEEMDSSVVRIVVRLKNEFGTGSGVVVSRDGHVLTNAHVIDQADQIIVLTGNDDNYKEHIASIIWSKNDVDLALIQVKGLDASPAVIYQDYPVKGGQVFAIGFPGVADGLSGGNALVESTVTQGIIGRVFNAPINNASRKVKIIQHNSDINGGNSGGGLFNVCGNLIGVNFALGRSVLEQTGGEYSIDQVNGMSLAVSISEARPMLEKQGIDLLLADECNAGSNSGSVSGSSQNQSHRQESGKISWDMSAVLYAIGLLSLVLASIAIWASYKKKSTYSESYTSWLRRKEPKPNSAGENRSPGLVLKGIDKSGNEFLVKLDQSSKFSLGMPVVIGRSGSESDFAIEDQSISRRHFEVMLKSNRIFLRDLDSTNGTKVNGLKITSEWVPVSAGSEIQAGNVNLTLRRS